MSRYTLALAAFVLASFLAVDAEAHPHRFGSSSHHDRHHHVWGTGDDDHYHGHYNSFEGLGIEGAETECGWLAVAAMVLLAGALAYGRHQARNGR